MKQAVFYKTAFIPVEIDMSVLTVSNVTHGFGARQILDDASFRLLKGEHVGLIGEVLGGGPQHVSHLLAGLTVLAIDLAETDQYTTNAPPCWFFGLSLSEPLS